MVEILLIAGCGLIAAGITFFITRTALMSKIKSNEQELKRKEKEMLDDINEKAEIIKKNKILETRENFLRMKTEHENDVNKRNAGLIANENRVKQKEQSINKKLEELQRKDTEVDEIKARLAKQNEAIVIRKEEVDKLHRSQVAQLEKIAGL